MKPQFEIEKHLWDDSDYDDLGWHDNRIYNLGFESKAYRLNIEIDYIFNWDEENTGFWVSPALLSFENIRNVEVGLSFKDTSDIIIDSIDRDSPNLTPNQQLTEMSYYINTNVGVIKLISTGFKMFIKEEPIFSIQQDLNRFTWST